MTTERILNFGEPLDGVEYVDRPGAYGLIFNDEKELALVETSHGIFLPGGGLEEDESPLDALEREVLEEVGIDILSARFIGEASQYHWSEQYQKHFKKIGSFYEVLQYATGGLSRPQAGHKLLWFPKDKAISALTQEFQSWVVGKYPDPIHG